MADQKSQRRLRDLEARIAALEAAVLSRPAVAGQAAAAAVSDVRASGTVVNDRSAPDPAGAGAGAADRSPAVPGRPVGPDAGVVSYSGDVGLHGHLVWNIGLAAAAVLDLPNPSGATVLAGLGHPTRAALTRRLLAGPASTAELQQVVEGSSTGQLYHHLRTLTGCGLAEQDGRGRYRVPPSAVIPALVLLLAAADVAGDLR